MSSAASTFQAGSLVSSFPPKTPGCWNPDEGEQKKLYTFFQAMKHVFKRRIISHMMTSVSRPSANINKRGRERRKHFNCHHVNLFARNGWNANFSSCTHPFQSNYEEIDICMRSWWEERKKLGLIDESWANSFKWETRNELQSDMSWPCKSVFLHSETFFWWI